MANQSESLLKDEFESRKAELDLILKQLEVEEKTASLAKRTGFFRKVSISPVEATLFVGLLGFLGSALVTYLQQAAQADIKRTEIEAQAIARRREFESQLVLAALKDGEATTALTRLRFLIEAGYLNDGDAKISNLILSGRYGGGTPIPSTTETIRAIATANLPAILDEILRVAQQAPTVDVFYAPHPGIAAALKRDGRHQIVFDPQAAQAIARDRKNNWTSVAILAHEVGHIVLGHLDEDRPRCLAPPPSTNSVTCYTAAELELEADRFSGFVLRRLGASQDDVRQAVAFLEEPSEQSVEHNLYPNRNARMAAYVAGWSEAACSRCVPRKKTAREQPVAPP